MKSIGLNNEHIGILEEIFRKHPTIEKVKIYGSRALGTYNERSDIDLVAFGSRVNRFDISDSLLDFDESDLPYSVDLQNFAELNNQKLIDHINRVGIDIYKRQE